MFVVLPDRREFVIRKCKAQTGDILQWSWEQLFLRCFLLLTFIVSAILGKINIAAKRGEDHQQNQRTPKTHYFLRLTRTEIPIARTDPGNRSSTSHATDRSWDSVIVTGRFAGSLTLMEIKLSSWARNDTALVRRFPF